MLTDDLSFEQLAGQRLMAGFEGTELNRELKFLVRTLKVGGVILFSRNIINPSQLKNLCISIQDYAASCGQPPLFIAVDQEGGSVARLRKPFFTEFSGNPYIKTEEDAREFAETTAGELLSAGINMNMAPVLDVAPKGIESVMAGRSFGSDPHHAARMGAAVLERMQENGVMAVSKHFPGIGRTTLDSHLDMPSVEIPLREMENCELIPFRSAIEKGTAGIMVSHIRYSKLDPHWPASLSSEIAGSLLRGRLGYKGLVITDDLDMGAIANHYDIKTAVDRALRAGVDIALTCRPGAEAEQAFEKILESAGKDTCIYREHILSAGRALGLKNRYMGSYAD